MKNKVFWIILALAIAGMVGMFVLTSGSSDSPNTSNSDQAVSTEDHIAGNPQAKTTLVEYGDFQCPACATSETNVNKLISKYGDEIKFVFRHFPLSGHANAFPAARAAEAAAAQGKFWEMEDLLYARQSDWSDDSNAIAKFREYARELKLDIDKFNTDYNSQATTNRINRDVRIGNDAGVGGTPTFYLNDKQIDTPANYEEFSGLVEEAIAAN